MQIQVPCARRAVGQFANCPTVSEGGRDADGKQRAGPDPSAEGQAPADAGEASVGGFLEGMLPDADDFPAFAAGLAQRCLPPSIRFFRQRARG